MSGSESRRVTKVRRRERSPHLGDCDNRGLPSDTAYLFEHRALLILRHISLLICKACAVVHLIKYNIFNVQPVQTGLVNLIDENDLDFLITWG